MGPRKLIKEGTLTKAKSGRKLYGFLCSDILVLTDASMKTLYKMVYLSSAFFSGGGDLPEHTQPVPLAHARVKEAHPYRGISLIKFYLASPAADDFSFSFCQMV